ncbi:hypothetical protein A2Z33_03935 [Candidatus Gottesmanbacteria bacterium RBG_16_52_11]|uniref:Membrane protein 6-pyruvoyl-tetrahydropterin synthase-related domain-containing protein n=1 Tax=Candidatus Gottesmanbacteria bacterium RBG_16_52_11 TaxID=1798374 RepID=A0A1F5YWJ3_9BACT|nr:MAG: hypothetical protein A2Z33_03935 [Candidatus Gottesmanbacteria bacterium RBG_16_52_11]
MRPVMRKIQGNDTLFVILLSAGLILLRFLAYDRAFFELKQIPGHDMSGGLAYFGPTIHSLELSGEPAYWSPAAPDGFALYFQSFIMPPSPLASSPIVHIWSQIVRFLTLLGYPVAEYFQYLVLQYLLYPFLSLVFFTALVMTLFRHRLTTVMLAATYFFTSMAAWLNSWFSYSETIAVFLLLWSSVSFVKKPTTGNFYLFLLGILYQGATFNYWTVNNLWFWGVLILVAGVFYFRKIAGAFLTYFRKKSFPGTVMTLTVAGIILFWLVVYATIVREQSDKYIRTSLGEVRNSESQILEDAPDIRRFYAGLVNPFPHVSEIINPSANVVHATRYLGLLVLPGILLSFLVGWKRRELALLTVVVAMSAICAGTPLTAVLIRITPFTDRIRQISQYNTWSLQLVLLLLAGSFISRFLRGQVMNSSRQAVKWLTVVSGTVLITLLSIITSSPLLRTVPRVPEVLTFAVLAQAGTVALLFLRYRTRGIAVITLLIAAVGIDGVRYYRDIENRDRAFTEGQYLVNAGFTPLVDSQKQILSQSWKTDPEQGFAGAIIANLPLLNYIWPDNSIYLENVQLGTIRQLPGWFYNRTTAGPPVEFVTETVKSAGIADPAVTVDLFSEPLKRGAILVSEPLPADPPDIYNTEAKTDGFSYRWLKWGYNGHRLEISAPDRGYLFFKLLYDPLWQIRVDGVSRPLIRANIAASAVQINPGMHTVHLEYRPFVRSVYSPLIYLTEAVLGILGLLAFSVRTRRLKSVAE